MKLYIQPLIKAVGNTLQHTGFSIVAEVAGRHFLFRQEFAKRSDAEMVRRRVGRFGFDHREWEGLPDEN